MVKWAKNWLRRKLNEPVVDELLNERLRVIAEARVAEGWDGTPANLVARINAYQHAVDIVRSDR